MDDLEKLLGHLWEDYAAINVQARRIHELLQERGEKIVNDHVAFRTFNLPKVGLEVLAELFKRLGYAPKAEYEFPEKKLFARHFEHPDAGNPKIFISELKVESFSEGFKKIIRDLVDQIPKERVSRRDFLYAGILWKPVAWEVYLKLDQESDYASWLAAFGYRANHFTVAFNALKNFKRLDELNAFLKKHGFKLNASGGEVKGSPSEYLEQSSTLAKPVEIQFANKKSKIPSCYYEFARRYPLPDGSLFQGFVAPSADKLFESTDRP